MSEHFWKRVQRGQPEQCWPWIGSRLRGRIGVIAKRFGVSHSVISEHSKLLFTTTRSMKTRSESMPNEHAHIDPIIKTATLNALVGDARLAAERSINPRFRKAYEDLEAAASHCMLLQEEDRRCCA